MKKYIIASIISIIAILPGFILLAFLGMTYTFGLDNNIIKSILEPLLLGKFNNIFLFYSMLIGILGLSIILTTIIYLSNYTDKIDKLDEEISFYNTRRRELERKILNL